MRCIIAGSRTINDYELLVEAFTSCSWSAKITEIVSGGARGVDSMGEKLAREKHLDLQIMQALWDIHGKSAGHRRNRDMAEYTDIAIVLWDGKSRGAKNMIDTMKKLDKPCIVHIVSHGRIVAPELLDEELFRI